ncbi:hypothetical protein MNEG_13705 [Monoraphidium neglectum]|uniref:RRM domain-containing protein n=1 Tax=Monoraphidium neglectum TaxID=145388 RepID=A0A0D2LXN3_9CHLO|nr:hypothetical protein MNEG_13705 [Monoraphidium neglectum]KIY94256.1 hypothetical protein MNEG_13705 [Monoraphidium neglectum]|eukprot:XP_013893276.1 hypothetical protein MNEG_13705 [Monoraphidium neglectum]
MEDSCMSLHSMEPRAKAVWSTPAPLPGVGSDASAAGRGGDPLADALAQHMLLLDMDGDLSYEDEEAAAAQHQRLQQQAAQTRGPHAAANPAAAAAAPAPAAAEPLPELPPLPAQPPSPVPEGSEGGGCESPCAAGEYQSEPLPLLDADLLRSKHAPLAPTGFTPAEAYVDRQERTVFFAKCAPSASVEAVARVFGAYGEVEEINLFRQW